MKRKKNSRMRGKTTHGYGSMKKNRGAGHRGGRGRAGSGKRGDAKKQSYQKAKRYMGKFGFKMHGSSVELKPINIITLNKKIESLVGSKKAKMEEGFYVVNLKDIGYNKLLGKGDPLKYKITTKYATNKAIEKIKSAGEIIIENVDMESDSKQSS